ncbi:alginate O-acetyltransferase AlgX-related protein [Nannocystis punicea]|uniref:AlgX/AlgJ SGNH hydrolase-like domain-containing protein n=1 Tax=Nannocystis punicea TaxID=2995304 RepID=A0ABY7H044_9BACT|nr:hypothetical protein [Nannocystis poenicansa]WAS92610.1 hypothetical protein O0S08_41050 [Nannocystis poenicansa]
MVKPAEPPSLPPRRRGLRALSITAQLLFGLGLGAALTEVAFSVRDGGAFPHVNFYVADPELGVRLEPGATMEFQLKPNPSTTIHVNSRGYRGDEWPAPGGDEVIVVGDSQVFGLGVDDDRTFSAQLAQLSGRPVVNGGVPTYGPMEYLAVARELLAERQAKTVVVVLNFVNDPFEIDRPNRERHAVWDGWAVRSETAPTQVTQFPGRRWLFSKSHAFYTLRRWLHERGSVKIPEDSELGSPVDVGTPSEGGLDDLVLASRNARAAADAEHQTAVAALTSSRTRLDAVDKQIADQRVTIDRKLASTSESEQLGNFQLEVARGKPGDIVREDYGESSRSIQVTAGLIRQAAKLRNDHLAAQLKKEEKAGKTELKDLVKAEADLVAEQQRLRKEIAAGVPQKDRPPSRFHEYLQQFKAMCDEYGAELVVVALPIDVQVDPGEWAKYDVRDAPDMQDSLILLDDLVADAEALGLRAVDVTAALRSAQPGAFLDHDIHMTAKGHAAFAVALADRLKTPLPTPLQAPQPGLPPGRSFVPTAAEWASAPEVKVTGSTALGCSTQIEREWLRVQCRRRTATEGFGGVVVREGATPATMAMRTADGLSLVTPLTVGEPLTARFHWKKEVQDLQIRWPAGDDGKPKFVGEFVKAEPTMPPADAAAEAAIAGLCACHKQARKEQLCAQDGKLVGDYEPYAYDCKEVCSDLWGDPSLIAACTLKYPEDKDCAARLACAQNDPLFPPTCPEGQVHAFASNHCRTPCDEAHPCEAGGRCMPWQSGGVCL